MLFPILYRFAILFCNLQKYFFYLQVEMFLLGCTLGVRIQVFRLSQFGESDFISYYPDDGADGCQTVSLMAEDDRHYNVPVL